MIREILYNEIQKAVKNLFGKDFDFSVSADEKYGDYSSNAAILIGGNPRENAEKIKRELESSKNFSQYISRIEIANQGFLNFWLKDEVFIKNIGEILKTKEKYGSNDLLKGKKIMVEYTDPNPFKEFHIGHLMSNAIGESIARLYEAQSANVKRACYQGDVGLHVAKTIYGLLHGQWFLSDPKGGNLNYPNGFPDAESMRDYVDRWVNKGPLNIELTYRYVGILGRAYAYGAKMYEENEGAKEEFIEINKKIYERSDKFINDFYDIGRQWSLNYFEAIYHYLLGMKEIKNGKHFDFYFFESETGKEGKEIVEENLGKIFEKSEGAVIFPKEKSDLHTRVFISSDGLPTYEAKELGLAKIKDGKYKADESIIITGNEINEYFKVLLKAMEFIFPEIARKTKHLSHGMLRLPSGKMSSRTGDVIMAVNLMADVEKIVLERIKDRNFDEREKKEILVKVANAAVKYSILKQSSGGDIIFNFEKSISFEGDSGPYIQYTYVRTQSVLRKAEEDGITEFKNIDIVKNEKISDVERLIQKFPEIVEMAAEKYAPNYVCSYLVELCHAFNSYYAKYKIVSSDDVGKYRISLSRAVGIVLKNGLNLLGISAPNKM